MRSSTEPADSAACYCSRTTARRGAKKRSFTLFAEEVVPALRGSSAPRLESKRWTGANADVLLGGMTAAITEAVARYADGDADGDGAPSVESWLPTRD